jgi:hypothetical protein
VAGHRPQQQCRAGAQGKRTDKVYRPRPTSRPPVAPTPLGERDRGAHEERRKHHAPGHEVHSARDPSTHETQRIAGEVDACTLDETIHHYHRAAGELWKFCFSGGGGSHAEFIAGVLDRMAADAETIDWWERATSRRRQ